MVMHTYMLKELYQSQTLVLQQPQIMPIKKQYLKVTLHLLFA